MALDLLVQYALANTLAAVVTVACEARALLLAAKFDAEVFTPEQRKIRHRQRMITNVFVTCNMIVTSTLFFYARISRVFLDSYLLVLCMQPLHAWTSYMMLKLMLMNPRMHIVTEEPQEPPSLREDLVPPSQIWRLTTGFASYASAVFIVAGWIYDLSIVLYLTRRGAHYELRVADQSSLAVPISVLRTMHVSMALYLCIALAATWRLVILLRNRRHNALRNPTLCVMVCLQMGTVLLSTLSLVGIVLVREKHKALMNTRLLFGYSTVVPLLMCLLDTIELNRLARERGFADMTLAEHISLQTLDDDDLLFQIDAVDMKSTAALRRVMTWTYITCNQELICAFYTYVKSVKQESLFEFLIEIYGKLPLMNERDRVTIDYLQQLYLFYVFAPKTSLRFDAAIVLATKNGMDELRASVDAAGAVAMVLPGPFGRAVDEAVLRLNTLMPAFADSDMYSKYDASVSSTALVLSEKIAAMMQHVHLGHRTVVNIVKG